MCISARLKISNGHVCCSPKGDTGRAPVSKCENLQHAWSRSFQTWRYLWTQILTLVSKTSFLELWWAAALDVFSRVNTLRRAWFFRATAACLHFGIWHVAHVHMYIADARWGGTRGWVGCTNFPDGFKPVACKVQMARAIMAVAFPNSTICMYRRMEAEDNKSAKARQLWKPKLMRYFFSDVDLYDLMSKLDIVEVWFSVFYLGLSYFWFKPQSQWLKINPRLKALFPCFTSSLSFFAYYSSSFASSHSKRIDMCPWPDFMSNAIPNT